MSRAVLLLIVAVSSVFALKEYSGIRAFNDTTLRVFHHREAVAVVEYGRNRVFHTCELIEVLTDDDKRTTLASLSKVIRKKPYQLNFDQMMDLMRLCAQLPEPIARHQSIGARSTPERTYGGFGIVPGTKWCGNGDIARHYFDLGSEAKVDRCCRMHDICPVKVLGSSTKYSIKNEGLFTILHCECDMIFLDCLKETKNSIANSMGGIYFNILGGNCMYSNDGKFLLGTKPRY